MFYPREKYSLKTFNKVYMHAYILNHINVKYIYFADKISNTVNIDLAGEILIKILDIV